MTAQRPDGRNSGQRVSFTRQGADRIARVVRTVESGDKKGRPLQFSPRLAAPAAGTIRVCTFTASWDKNTEQTVTLKYQTTTPNTLVATNLFADIVTASTASNCAVARDGTSWFLIAAECA